MNGYGHWKHAKHIPQDWEKGARIRFAGITTLCVCTMSETRVSRGDHDDPLSRLCVADAPVDGAHGVLGTGLGPDARHDSDRGGQWQHRFFRG